MTTYDVALYGMMYFDHIVDTDKIVASNSIGGCGNVARHLHKIAPDMKVAISPTAFSDAVIWGDRGYIHHRRTYRGNIFVDAKWHHVCYPDECPEFCFDFPAPIGITSIAYQKNMYNASAVDYVFIPQYVSAYQPLYNVAMIRHSESGGILETPSGAQNVVHPTLENINTLGAGDMLVAEVIVAILRGETIQNCISSCHANVVKELKKRNGICEDRSYFSP